MRRTINNKLAKWWSVFWSCALLKLLASFARRNFRVKASITRFVKQKEDEKSQQLVGARFTQTLCLKTWGTSKAAQSKHPVNLWRTKWPFTIRATFLTMGRKSVQSNSTTTTTGGGIEQILLMSSSHFPIVHQPASTWCPLCPFLLSNTTLAVPSSSSPRQDLHVSVSGWISKIRIKSTSGAHILSPLSQPRIPNCPKAFTTIRES